MIEKKSCWKTWPPRPHQWWFHTDRMADVVQQRTGVMIWRQCFRCGYKPLKPYKVYVRDLDMEEMFDIQEQWSRLKAMAESEE